MHLENQIVAKGSMEANAISLYKYAVLTPSGLKIKE